MIALSSDAEAMATMDMNHSNLIFLFIVCVCVNFNQLVLFDLEKKENDGNVCVLIF